MRRLMDALRRFNMSLPLDIRDYEAIKRAQQQAKNIQVGGNHYQQMTIQPVEFIEKNNLSYCQGNVIKYVCRYNTKHSRKEQQVQDLEKAKHYIDLLIASLKKQ